MLVPKLRFKREDGTDYPEWKDCILSDYCEEIKASIDPKKYPNDSFLEYSMPAFDMGKIPNNVIGRDMNSNRKVVNYPCVLINKLNVRKKRIWKVLKPMSNSVCSAEFIPVKSDKMSIDFLECLALSDRFTARLLDCSTGTSNSQKRVTPNIIMDMSVSIPCLEEQQKIADFLSALDEVIIQSEAEVQNLEQQKKSAMQKIFSQELRFKREDGTDYPEWEENAISDLFEVSAGGDIDKANSRKEYGEDYPYAVYANALTNRGLYGYANYYKIGCDCFTVTGRGDVGYAIARHEKFVPIVRLLVCIPKHNENVDCFAEIVNYTNVFVDNTGVPQLTSIQLGKIRVAYPTDIEEQQKIADFLSALDEAISYAKQELDKWKELKKGLLQQMFV